MERSEEAGKPEGQKKTGGGKTIKKDGLYGMPQRKTDQKADLPVSQRTTAFQKQAEQSEKQGKRQGRREDLMRQEDRERQGGRRRQRDRESQEDQVRQEDRMSQEDRVRQEKRIKQEEQIKREDLGRRPGKALCPVAGRCGGCQWIDRDYQEQLKIKETRFRKLMETYCKTEPILGMEQPAYYRNKVHAAFGEDRKHNIISGIYEEKSHRIVPLDRCYIENQKADQIIVSIRGLMKSFKIRPYNEDTGFGLLRHVLIRTGYATGQIMVVLILSSPVMPSKNHFVKALLKLHPEITTIVLNINNRDTAMVLGDKEQVIYGKGYIEDEICGKCFRISAKSFYQVNPIQAEILYRKAIEYAGLTGRETVVDAYCGTGTIGIIAADSAGSVIGVEANQDAVKDARNNAKKNRTANIEFYQNDAGKVLTEMAEQSASVDLVMMDPPRSGSSEEFLEAAVRLAPPRIVYISCNPDTLVRDLKYLTAKGYEAKRAVAVDMFPFTEHVETVCLLTKKAR